MGQGGRAGRPEEGVRLRPALAGAGRSWHTAGHALPTTETDHGSPHPPHRALRQGHQGDRRLLREGVRPQAHRDQGGQDRLELLHERRRGQPRAAAIQGRGRLRRAQRLDRHPPLRLPVRRPAGATEAGREGRRQVLLRSRRSRGRRLRAQVQGPERHRLRHQLEGLAAHQKQGEERQGRPHPGQACDETRRRGA